ncbi:MAG: hypothetical protein ACOY9J_02525 [Pseudomonadota bacterium]
MLAAAGAAAAEVQLDLARYRGEVVYLDFWASKSPARYPASLPLAFDSHVRGYDQGDADLSALIFDVGYSRKW